MKRNGDLVHRNSPKTPKTPARCWPLVLAFFVLGLALPANPALSAKLVANSPPTWDRTYGGMNFDKATSVKPVPGGGFVISGFRPSRDSKKPRAWVMRLDERGDVVWEGLYGESTSAASVIPLSRGGFVAVGASRLDGGEGFKAWILRLDDGGKKMWERTSGEHQNDLAISVAPVPGGGFYVAGYSYADSHLVRDTWVMRLDQMGRKLWRRTFSGKSMGSGNGMAALPGGGLVMAGAMGKGEGENKKAWVLRLDDKGNLLWQRTFAEHVDDFAEAIAPAPDGGFVVAGKMVSEDRYDRPHGWVYRLDGQGLKIWQYLLSGNSIIYPTAILTTRDHGFVVVGDINKGEFSRGDPHDAYLLKLNPQGRKLWERILGGDRTDVLNSIASAPGGGFVLAGYTESKGAGEADAWLLRLDDKGRDTWNRTFGGAGIDGFLSLAMLSDGSIAMGGVNRSRGSGLADAWVIRLDPDGEETWERLIGGNGRDMVLAIAAEKKPLRGNGEENGEGNGLVLAGLTQPGEERQDDDLLVGRLDGKGNLLWKRALGGSQNDAATSIVALPDGGILLAGFTRSKGRGRADAWILRLNGLGKVLWERTFGSSGFDIPWSVAQVADGGFIFAGETTAGETTAGGKAVPGRQGKDAWVMRLDAQGDPLWEKTFGGEKYDILTAIATVPGGGFILAGNTESKGAGRNDGWIVRLDAQGEMLWERTYGKKNRDAFWSITVVPDAGSVHGGGFAVAGQIGSTRAGYSDAWVLRLDQQGRVLWEKTFGGKKGDSARAILPGPRGGFIVAGSTESRGAGRRDGWMFRLDANGRLR